MVSASFGTRTAIKSRQHFRRGRIFRQDAFESRALIGPTLATRWLGPAGNGNSKIYGVSSKAGGRTRLAEGVAKGPRGAKCAMESHSLSLQGDDAIRLSERDNSKWFSLHKFLTFRPDRFLGPIT